MRRYSDAVKADVRRQMSPPMRQSVAQISAELGIHVVTLYNWRKVWRLQGEVVPASEKELEQGLLEVCPISPGGPSGAAVCSSGLASHR
jgi:transposase-like protein